MKIPLIIPFAAQLSNYPNLLEKKDGRMAFFESILSIPKEFISKVYVIVLQSELDRWGYDEVLQNSWCDDLLSLEIICLDTITNSQAETIALALRILKISGAFWVKDPDSSFDMDYQQGNSIAVFPLDELTQVNPQNKSYLSISDTNFIVNLAEKRIISRYFSTGGYGFDDANKFLIAYDKIKDFGKIYLSHVIYQLLLDGENFRPIYIKNYKDWSI